MLISLACFFNWYSKMSFEMKDISSMDLVPSFEACLAVVHGLAFHTRITHCEC